MPVADPKSVVVSLIPGAAELEAYVPSLLTNCCLDLVPIKVHIVVPRKQRNPIAETLKFCERIEDNPVTFHDVVELRERLLLRTPVLGRVQLVCVQWQKK